MADSIRTAPPTADDFAGQRQRRIEKVKQLRELGIDPYPAHSRKDMPNSEVKSRFAQLENTDVTLAGRLMTWRDHGKMIFTDLQDQSGTIQLWLKKNTLIGATSEGTLGWTNLKLLDIGDFVEVHGTVTKTTRGEVTLLVKKIRILAKTIRPLPNTFDHKEAKFRRRYLDLTINPGTREIFLRKAKFWEANREYMKQHGFIEVEVPVLEHVTGGADARPFVTHHNDLEQDFYLRISTELYQKRLIGGGFEKIFTLGPNFRNEGLSDEHLQEYYQIEWYWAYADYRDNMAMVRDMIRTVAQQVWGTTKFATRGHEFDLADEWKEIDYVQVIRETHGVDIFTATDDELKRAVEKLGIELPGAVNRARLIDNLWKAIRKTIAGPVFLINEPAFMSPLAKAKPDNPKITERFHVVIGGSELGNGYSEINDPQYQLQQFLNQQVMREAGDDEAQMLDIDYVEMLEYGMPPTSGYAHSERLFWFLENVTAREGTLFPQLKYEVEQQTRELYEPILKPLNITLDKETSGAGTYKKSGKAKKAPTVNYQPVIPREKALALVNDHIANKNLVKHCIAVESAMRALARHFGEDEDLWGLVGLMHDADWEETSHDATLHTLKTVAWLKEAGETNETVFRAILAHNFMTNPEPAPETRLEWSLFCCDELTGLITAAALVLPDKKLSSLTLPSIMKKFRNPKFAAAVDRDHIALCEKKLGIPLEEFVQIVWDGMKTYAVELGL
ncbi:MAG: lysine--tRNA ligase [Patescibacteria group bacterium]|nr:lysine--tRNA ligase [Patescibacteria group bacterium]